MHVLTTNWQVAALKAGGDPIQLQGDGEVFDILADDIEICTIALDSVPADCALESDGHMTVMLDTSVGQKQKDMGVARDFAARVQKLRKSAGLREHDEVEVWYGAGDAASAIENNLEYTNGILKVPSPILPCVSGEVFSQLSSRRHVKSADEPIVA